MHYEEIYTVHQLIGGRAFILNGAKRAAAGIMALLALWIVVSFVDITNDNSKPNPEHWQYNFFTVCFK